MWELVIIRIYISMGTCYFIFLWELNLTRELYISGGELFAKFNAIEIL